MIKNSDPITINIGNNIEIGSIIYPFFFFYILKKISFADSILMKLAF